MTHNTGKEDADYVPTGDAYEEYTVRPRRSRRLAAKKGAEKDETDAESDNAAPDLEHEEIDTAMDNDADEAEETPARKKKKPAKKTTKKAPAKSASRRKSVTPSKDDATPVKKPKVPTRLNSLDVYVLTNILSYSMYSLNEVFSMMLISKELFEKICQNGDFWESVLNRLCEHPWIEMLDAVQEVHNDDHITRVIDMQEYLQSADYKEALQKHLAKIRKKIDKKERREQRKLKKEALKHDEQAGAEEEQMENKDDAPDDDEESKIDLPQYPISPSMKLIKSLKSKSCCDACMLRASGGQRAFVLNAGPSTHDTPNTKQPKNRRIPILDWNGPKEISLCSRCKGMTLTKTCIGPLLCIPLECALKLPRKFQSNPYNRSSVMQKMSLHSLAVYATKYYPFSNDLRAVKQAREERSRKSAETRAKNGTRRKKMRPITPSDSDSDLD